METEIKSLLKGLFFDDGKVNKWYETPHPHFNNLTPKQLVEAGRGDEFYKFCRQCLGHYV